MAKLLFEAPDFIDIYNPLENTGFIAMLHYNKVVTAVANKT